MYVYICMYGIYLFSNVRENNRKRTLYISDCYELTLAITCIHTHILKNLHAYTVLFRLIAIRDVKH